MRSLLFFSCFLSIFTCFTQDLLTTDPVLVADGFGNNHPQIEVTTDNRVNISWTDPHTNSIYFAKHNGVDGFNDPVQLNPEDFSVASYSWSGPDFDYEGSNVYVVFQAENSQSYLVKSTDNGNTFGDSVRIAGSSAHNPSYPDVAVFNDTVYATFMNHEDETGISPDYVFARSVDGGESFEDFVIASELLSDEVCDCCPPEIIVNEQYVIIFFRNNEDNIREIKAVISFDRGESFTDWFSVDDHAYYAMSCPSTGPDARFIDEQTVVSVYKSVAEGTPRVYFNATDLSTGTELQLEEMVMTGALNAGVNYPQVAYDDGLIGVVWEGVGSGSSLDIFFNSTTREELDFNPDNALHLISLPGAQAKPDIAIKSGLFHIVYAGADGALYYLQVGEATGIAEKEISFNAYYDPNQQDLVIKTDEITTVEILDINGKPIHQTLVQGNDRINTSGWSKGLYIVRVQQNGKSACHKFIR